MTDALWGYGMTHASYPWNEPQTSPEGSALPRQLVRWEMGLEPHTEADVARTMSATLGFLAAAEA